MAKRSAGRRRGVGGFRPLEEVAASAGALLYRGDRGRHLRAMVAWRAAVGSRVDRVTRVTRVGRDAVTVEVPDRVWGETLGKMESEILGRFRERLGRDCPRRIEFQVAPGFWRPDQRVPRSGGAAGDAKELPPDRPAEPARRPVPDDVLQPGDLPVADPRLRDALCRLGNRYLARGGG